MIKFSDSAGHNTPYNVGAAGIKSEGSLNLTLWGKIMVLIRMDGLIH